MKAAIAIVALVFASACRSSSAEPPSVTPFARALMTVGYELGAVTEGDVESGVSVLRNIAARVQEIVRGAPATSAATALNLAVFETAGFAREVDDPDLRFVLLPAVLQNGRGSCVGLGTLYLALADMLGFPIEGVMVPGHFYVRTIENGRRRNIELLRRGEQMPDTWYRTRYPDQTAAAAGEPQGRVLSSQEVLGVVAYNVGQERRRVGRLRGARRAYEQAVSRFPDFAEAHASLGATLHLLGALDLAKAAYEEARRVNPALPGIDRNLQLLHAEAVTRP